MCSKKALRMIISAVLAAAMTLPSAFALYPAKVKADALYLRQSPAGDNYSHPAAGNDSRRYQQQQQLV